MPELQRAEHLPKLALIFKSPGKALNTLWYSVDIEENLSHYYANVMCRGNSLKQLNKHFQSAHERDRADRYSVLILYQN